VIPTSPSTKGRKVEEPDSNRTWDPGDPSTRNKLVKIQVSSHIYSLIATVMVADVADVDVGRGDGSMEEEELS